MTNNPRTNTIVVGQVMKTLGTAFAEATDKTYFRNTPDRSHDGLAWRPSLQNKIDLCINRRWIDFQMMEGKHLADVGGPKSFDPSDFYDMGRSQKQRFHVGSYVCFSEAWPDIRGSWDLAGGVPS